MISFVQMVVGDTGLNYRSPVYRDKRYSVFQRVENAFSRIFCDDSANLPHLDLVIQKIFENDHDSGIGIKIFKYIKQLMDKTKRRLMM